MEINCTITNEEDISYLENIKLDDKDKILKTAITIGLKSIQMSETKLDCHSYIDPIRSLIQESTSGNNTAISIIDDKLNDLLHLKSNSNRKGKLSEEICIQLLNDKYPSWSFYNISQESYEGDCRAIESDIGPILYEFKCYDTNINRDQILKFHRDLEYTGVKYGIFVSNTSGIVGKKNIDWEILNDKLLIYVSNMGMNGYGCIIATELLVALVSINIFDKEKNWLYSQNIDLNFIKENLIGYLDTYKENLELITKHKYLIQEQRTKINQCMEILEKDIFQIELNSKNILEKMLQITDEIHIEKFPLESIQIEQFLDKILNKKMKFYYGRCIQIANQYEIKTKQNELYFLKDKQIIAYTKSTKVKIDICFPIVNDTVQLDLRYDKIKQNIIMIELKDDINLWEYIQNKFKSMIV